MAGATTAIVAITVMVMDLMVTRVMAMAVLVMVALVMVALARTAVAIRVAHTVPLRLLRQHLLAVSKYA
jgi:hypothetical protein